MARRNWINDALSRCSLIVDAGSEALARGQAPYVEIYISMPACRVHPDFEIGFERDADSTGTDTPPLSGSLRRKSEQQDLMHLSRMLSASHRAERGKADDAEPEQQDLMHRTADAATSLP
jgi:hypothetical protein